MINIFIAGKGCESAGLTVCRAFSNYGRVIYDCRDVITEYSDGAPEIFISCREKPPELCSASAAVLLTSHGEAPQIGEKALIIAPDTAGIENALTYGFSKECAVTLSSFSGDSAAVSIQNPFETIFGEQIYPCDIAVDITCGKNSEPYQLLAACTLLIACGLEKGGRIKV